MTRTKCALKSSRSSSSQWPDTAGGGAAGRSAAKKPAPLPFEQPLDICGGHGLAEGLPARTAALIGAGIGHELVEG